MSGGKGLMTAVAAGLVMAGGAHGHHHGPGILDAFSAHRLGGTRAQSAWAKTLLRAGGLPVTGCNRRFVVAWELAEGGHWQNSASFNPLNTTMREPGSHAINSVGVQAYGSWRQGMRATVATLNNGRYPGVIAALRAGDSAQSAADAVGASPWGTGPFAASC